MSAAYIQKYNDYVVMGNHVNKVTSTCCYNLRLAPSLKSTVVNAETVNAFKNSFHSFIIMFISSQITEYKVIGL